MNHWLIELLVEQPSVVNSKGYKEQSNLLAAFVPLHLFTPKPQNPFMLKEKKL